MKLNSHIVLANVVSDILEDQINVKIERDMLELGAVYPDCNIKKRFHIHNVKQVYRNYYLQSENIVVKNKNKYGVSFTLGLLSHYVCDSFCLAHNKHMRGVRDFKKHVNYENGLAEYIYQYEIEESILDMVQSNYNKTYDFNVQDFLGEYHKRYLAEEKDSADLQFKLDVENAIFASTMITSGFIHDLEKVYCPAVEVLYV